MVGLLILIALVLDVSGMFIVWNLLMPKILGLPQISVWGAFGIHLFLRFTNLMNQRQDKLPKPPGEFITDFINRTITFCVLAFIIHLLLGA
jgi:hypothetical protein